MRSEVVLGGCFWGPGAVPGPIQAQGMQKSAKSGLDLVWIWLFFRLHFETVVEMLFLCFFSSVLFQPPGDLHAP